MTKLLRTPLSVTELGTIKDVSVSLFLCYLTSFSVSLLILS